MSKAICYLGKVLALLCVLFFPFQFVDAQVTPTNTATISGSVNDSTGKPVANAKVSLSGPKMASTQTDAYGLFVFVGVPFGTYQISAAAAGFGTATRSISVTGDTDVAIQYELASQNGLKVIANVSSVANARVNVTAASITQVNPIANAFEGKTSWRTILEQIPGLAQAGVVNGGYYSDVADSPLMPVQISINGALPYETAILLDDMPLIGRSFATAAGTGTNLGFYPLNGFSSADVVRGPGANAPSIVDSIGGSFVLHSPGTVSSEHYDLSTSTDPYGGIVANGLAAVRWKKLSAVITYGVNDSPGPLNGAGIAPRTLFTPSTINGSAFACDNSCAAGTSLFVPNYANCYGGYGVQTGLLTGGINQSTTWSQHSGSAALTYTFSPTINAEIFYAGQSSSVPIAYWYCTDNFVPPAGYAGAFSPGQHLLSISNYFLAPWYTTQSSSLLEEKIIAQVGRGVLHLGALQNRTFALSSLATPTSATLQLYGGGALCSNTTLPCNNANPTYTPTIFNGGTYNIAYPGSYAASSVGWSNNRDLLLSYTTPLGEGLQAGISFVKSYYDAPSNSIGSFFGVQFGSSTPTDISQTTNEMRVFIGGNPSAKTSLDLSTYFANADYHVQNPNNVATYTDARYTYSAPRLGFVWRPTPSVAVRAAVGGGFAEAPLCYLVGSNGVPSNSNLGYYTVTLTNINIQPERSFGFDLGTDIRLHRSDMLSLDVYRSNLYGQFYNSTSITGTYLGLPLYTTQYGNLGVSRYEGVLLDLRHDLPRGIYWSFSGGLTRGYVVSLPADFYNTAGGTCNLSSGANCQNLTVVQNINFNVGFTTVSIPYAQGLGTIGYRWNPEKYVDLVGTYFGNNNTYFRPAFVELDGHVGYPLSRNISLLMTFRNITGIYDGAILTYTPTNFIGVPTISGPPISLSGNMYGPRTIIFTALFHLQATGDR